MGRKEHLSAIAAETMGIIERGSYHDRKGRPVDISESLRLQAEGTAWYREGQPLPSATVQDMPGMLIEVTAEFPGDAVEARAGLPGETLCLVFASARRPGGGFLDGANAQEESLARASTLPASLLSVPGFYEGHRASRDLRYSDGMIYTPHASLIRDVGGRLLDNPVRCAFLTAPAPNAGAMARNQAGDLKSLPMVLGRRAARILDVAAAHGHRRLVLGAWGCGVFGNDPATVADAFRKALRDRPWFDVVTFAVPDPASPQHRAFAAAFGPR